jgi:hypothetical protein
MAAVNERNRAFHKQFGDELCDDSGAPLFGHIQGIQPRSDPVEGSKQGEFKMTAGAIGVDHAIQELLAAGVNPALFLNRPDDEETFILLEFGVGAGTINLGCRGEYNTLMILNTLFDNGEIHLKVQVV